MSPNTTLAFKRIRSKGKSIENDIMVVSFVVRLIFARLFVCLASLKVRNVFDINTQIPYTVLHDIRPYHLRCRFTNDEECARTGHCKLPVSMKSTYA